jgi:hypothetical protein
MGKAHKWKRGSLFDHHLPSHPALAYQLAEQGLGVPERTRLDDVGNEAQWTGAPFGL